MDVASQIAAEEQVLGRWPRRLLHVPTMTSHEWRPGNFYGLAQSPEYSAVTYTWGRWRLEDADMRHVASINIGGVPWKIPRVDPAHFTAAEFLRVLQAATQPVAVDVGRRYTTPVEFVWLDVACIDQRPNEPRSASEIGRQAEIFKGARNVFAWLTAHSWEKLQLLLTDLNQLGSSVGRRRRLGDQSTGQIADSIYRLFETLFADPWFTSLWTLQEAFLRQDAVFLPRDGRLTLRLEDSTPYNFDLTAVMGTYEELGIDQQRAEGTRLSGSLERCARLADDAGLSAIITQSVMVALAAATKRTAVKDEDRVYAIQQMFGFRLGTTAVNATPGKTFTREELEVQLGRELLVAYPIHSQTHVFTRPPTLGDGWRVNSASVIPEFVSVSGNPVFEYNPTYDCVQDGTLSADSLAVMMDVFAEYTRPKCRLSIRNIQGRTWGWFQGTICPLQTVIDESLRYEQLPLVNHLFDSPIEDYCRALLKIRLDASTFLAGCPEDLSEGFYDVYNRPRQRALAQWLSRSFPTLDIVVMLLGPIEDQISRRACMCGMLLLRTRQIPLGTASCWRRLGFCEWDIHHMTIGGQELPGYHFFHGETKDWTTASGYFG